MDAGFRGEWPVRGAEERARGRCSIGVRRTLARRGCVGSGGFRAVCRMAPALAAGNVDRREVEPNPDAQRRETYGADRGLATSVLDHPRYRSAPLVRTPVAREGRRCRTDPDRVAGSPRDGVRGTRGPSRDHGSLHVGLVSPRVRRVRSLAGPGPGTRLFARPDDRRDDRTVAPGGWGPLARCGARFDARAAGWGRDGPGGLREARVRGGPAVQADPDRLHERPGPHDPDRSVAQAVRVLHRCRRSHRRDGGLRRRRRGWFRRGGRRVDRARVPRR